MAKEPVVQALDKFRVDDLVEAKKSTQGSKALNRISGQTASHTAAPTVSRRQAATSGKLNRRLKGFSKTKFKKPVGKGKAVPKAKKSAPATPKTPAAKTTQARAPRTRRSAAPPVAQGPATAPRPPAFSPKPIGAPTLPTTSKPTATPAPVPSTAPHDSGTSWGRSASWGQKVHTGGWGKSTTPQTPSSSWGQRSDPRGAMGVHNAGPAATNVKKPSLIGRMAKWAGKKIGLSKESEEKLEAKNLKTSIKPYQIAKKWCGKGVRSATHLK
jgi:hypothetical protein